jgi:eukaryotic-like serine/threonine-protein kinase
MAQDIERFANHEPVSAGPPTAAYRFKKFVRRNRAQMVATSLVLLALVGGIIGTTLGLVEARRQTAEAKRQQFIAVAETVEKEKARKAEAFQRQQAEKRLTQIEKANEILGSVFKDLNPKNEEKDGKPLAARLGERLDQATAQIEGEAIGDPLTVARMQLTLGQSQLGLGYPEKAITLLTKARATFTAQLGPDHPDTLESMNELAEGYRAAGEFDHALPLFEETLALFKSKLGPDHSYTLASMDNLASCYWSAKRFDRSIPLLEECLKFVRVKSGEDRPDTMWVKASLGVNYRDAGRLAEALPLLEEANRAVRKYPALRWVRGQVLDAYSKAGRIDEAAALAKEMLIQDRAALPADSPQLAGMLVQAGLSLL